MFGVETLHRMLREGGGQERCGGRGHGGKPEQVGKWTKRRKRIAKKVTGTRSVMPHGEAS
jgi:hypothetical protein